MGIQRGPDARKHRELSKLGSTAQAEGRLRQLVKPSGLESTLLREGCISASLACTCPELLLSYRDLFGVIQEGPPRAPQLQGHIRGLRHLRQIFSLGRNCRKKKQASDKWLQKKKRNCPGRNDLQVPILKNKEAAELLHQQDLFRKRDPAGKNLHGDLKGYLQTA